MKIAVFLVILISCFNDEKWDKRFEELQKQQYDCITSWQQSAPNKVLALYRLSDSPDPKYNLDPYTDDQKRAILDFKRQLSRDDS
jgi:hypothetical protein